MEIYKAKEWQGASGRWFVDFCSHFGTDYSAWWFPARVFGLNLSDFVEMLVQKYKVDNFHITDKDQIIYSWDNYTYAHKFLLDLNKNARNKKIYILDKKM